MSSGPDMKVELLNNGPVTICMDTQKTRNNHDTGRSTEDRRRMDKDVRVRYFSELTNMAVLTEEVGELARIMARTYGRPVVQGRRKNGLGR